MLVVIARLTLVGVGGLALTPLTTIALHHLAGYGAEGGARGRRAVGLPLPADQRLGSLAPGEFRFPLTFMADRLTRWRYHGTSASGPEVQRNLRWGEEGLEMLRKHLRHAAPQHRMLIRELQRSKTFEVAQGAYHYCLETDRA